MTDWEGFFRLHDGLPREGPGDRATLDWALGHANLPATARILDAGCGPGGDIAGLLAHAPDGHVTAVDSHAPFIETVKVRFSGEPRVTSVTCDMSKPPGAPFDLIWCAGALYFLGLAEGLARMHDLLAPGGSLAISYPCHFRTPPSQAAKAFWKGEDLPIPTEDDIRAAFQAAGFLPVAARPLPDAAWKAYYTPLLERAARLETEPSLAPAIAETRAEAAAWAKAKEETGYLLVIGRRR
ncbi:class I SAM-dependent methyltransferase [Ovoidimarina sediminis]|uniref:class I SAM-dependent methyltransferase n=1 Tax=Ovoidimarina sediminis TaxID=3079856 RepID=UPI002910F2AF|nr:class I SAM-dependent methyltransferase [Rhodophyticola sp. MJ-SS7]MDU8941996.1 class I SAM-dependent methyltransferase [Rhodophyticola sp. MJ-SS7]